MSRNGSYQEISRAKRIEAKIQNETFKLYQKQISIPNRIRKIFKSWYFLNLEISENINSQDGRFKNVFLCSCTIYRDVWSSIWEMVENMKY